MSTPSGEEAERFRIEACLGTGTTGVVYRAYDHVRRATVAIKVLSRVDPSSLFRFKREFRQLAHVAHPNLVQLYGLTAHNDEWILSMELIEGGDFLRWVRPGAHEESGLAASDERDEDDQLDTLPPELANALQRRPDNAQRASARTFTPGAGVLDTSRLHPAFRQLAEGLKALHARGHLHRDLKPANVIVSERDQRVVICDFGLLVDRTVPRDARPASNDASGPVHGTFNDTQVGGTLPYMSPEQLQGDPLSEASDWYAVGVILYEALTGRLPCNPALSWREAIRAKRHPPIDPREIAPDVPGALADLALSLLRWEPGERPGYAHVISALGQPEGETSVTPPRDVGLVGRAAPLAELRAAFSRSAGGELTVAVVSGRSGLGKSALIGNFLADVERTANAIVLRGRCYEREDLPYKALDPLMDALSSFLVGRDDAEVTELLPEGIDALARMFPVLRRVDPIAVLAPRNRDEPSDRYEERRRAFHALRELCRRLARLAPLVLFVDDLQWGDLDSGPLLFELLRRPNAPALLLIGAFRSEDQERSPLLRALRDTHLPAAGVRRLVQIEIGELDASAMRELAGVLLSALPDAEGAVEFVAGEAAGSPLFARELATFVLARGLPAAKRTGLHGVIESRVRTLKEPARKLLAAIAVAGRPERRAVLDEAAGLGTDAIQAHRTLEAEHLVFGTGTRESDRVEAYHDKVRETVYRMLPDDERASLHAQVARAIERRDGEQADPDVLLEHYKAANDRVQVAACALHAAEKAESSLAFARAAELYGLAADAGAHDGEERRLLTEKLAFALSLAGRGPEAAEGFLRAVEGASPERATELRSLATTQLFRAGLVARGFDELHKAEHLLGMRVPQKPLTALFMLLWRRLHIRLLGLTLRKPKHGGEVSAALRQRMDLLWGVTGALAPMDQLRGGVYQAEHLLLALRSGDKYRFARALAIETTTWATGNKRPAQTQRVMDLGLELGGASREAHALSAVWGTTGVCRLLEGRFLEAIRLIRQSQEIQRERLRGTLVWDRIITQLFELRALALIGRVHELAALVPDMLHDAEERGDLFAAVSLRTSHCCWAWLGPGLLATAKREVATADRQWSQGGYHLQNWYTTQAVGTIALYEGDVDLARTRLEREWKSLFMLRRKIQFTRAEVLYMRARLDLAHVRAGGDRALLARVRDDARTLVREQTPWIVAHGRLLDACADSFDAPERAASLLFEVEGQLEAVDMRLSAAVCAYRRGRLVGGEGGATTAAQASDVMSRLGIADVDAFTRLLAPGFP